MIRERLAMLGASDERWTSWKEPTAAGSSSSSSRRTPSTTTPAGDSSRRSRSRPAQQRGRHPLAAGRDSQGAHPPPSRGRHDGCRQSRSTAVPSPSATADRAGHSTFRAEPLPYGRTGVSSAAVTKAAINRADDPPKSLSETADLLEALRRRRGERETANFEATRCRRPCPRPPAPRSPSRRARCPDVTPATGAARHPAPPRRRTPVRRPHAAPRRGARRCRAGMRSCSAPAPTTTWPDGLETRPPPTGPVARDATGPMSAGRRTHLRMSRWRQHDPRSTRPWPCGPRESGEKAAHRLAVASFPGERRADSARRVQCNWWQPLARHELGYGRAPLADLRLAVTRRVPMTGRPMCSTSSTTVARAGTWCGSSTSPPLMLRRASSAAATSSSIRRSRLIPAS